MNNKAPNPPYTTRNIIRQGFHLSIPQGMIRISHRKYAEFAIKLGASPVSKRVEADRLLVGWRSNRYSYVIPEAYQLVMNSSWYKPKTEEEKAVVSSCPTCKSTDIEPKELGGFGCLSCGCGFMY